jgi:tetratricopeptide (TPR) repeat protein
MNTNPHVAGGAQALSLALFFFCLAASLPAQEASWWNLQTPSASTSSSSFQPNFQMAMIALEKGEINAARAYLQAAKKSAKAFADAEGLRQADHALFRLRVLYSPYFKHREKGRAYYQAERFKEAQESFQAALALARRHEQSIDSPLNALDKQLRDLAESDYQSVSHQRAGYLLRKFQTAALALERGEPEQALSTLQNADALVVSQDERARFTHLLELAHYQSYLRQGDRLLLNRSHQDAIAAYDEALRHKDTPEGRARKLHAVDQYQSHLIAQATEAYRRGDHAAARTALEEAERHGFNEIIAQTRPNWARALAANGDAFFVQGQYQQARKYYGDALGYFNEPTLKEAAARNDKALAYQQSYAEGMRLIQAENLSAARRALLAARSNQNTPEVSAALKKLDDYFEKLKAGKGYLKLKQMELAAEKFAAAQALHDTREIRQWLQKTGKSPGGETVQATVAFGGR